MSLDCCGLQGFQEIQLKYNIAGRKISGLCDLKDNFLNEEVNSHKWAESMAVGKGVKAATTSDILICDYLVSQENVREFWNSITACGKHDLWQTLSWPCSAVGFST